MTTSLPLRPDLQRIAEIEADIRLTSARRSTTSLSALPGSEPMISSTLGLFRTR